MITPPDMFPLSPGDTVRWWNAARGEYFSGRFVRWTTHGNAVVEIIDENNGGFRIRPGIVKPAALRPSNDGRTLDRRGYPIYWTKEGGWTTTLETPKRRR